jgi:hypothetical protein
LSPRTRPGLAACGRDAYQYGVTDPKNPEDRISLRPESGRVRRKTREKTRPNRAIRAG